MPDFAPPVAQDVNVNPAQGLQTLSTLYGIQQQQQNIAYTRAEAQQAQQKNTELEALAQFTRAAATDPSYHNADGSVNVQKFQAGAQAAAPVYGQAYIGQATANANAMAQNRRALLSLSNEQRATIGNYFGAVAAKPNATREDFLDAAEQARTVSDDPAYQRSVDRMLMSAPNVRSLPTAQASQAIRQWARGISLETGAPVAAESGPAVSMVQGKTGLVPTNLNPQSPSGIGPVGPVQRQGVPPTGSVLTDSLGHQFRYNAQTNTLEPVGGVAAGATGPAAPSARPGAAGFSNVGAPTAALQTANAQAFAQRVQAGTQAANASPQAIDALTRARTILDSGTWTGGTFSAFKDLKNLVAGFGIDTTGAQNASELAKNLARYEAARAGSVGDTDAARSLYEAGAPNTKMDAGAVRAVVMQSLGIEKMILGYARVVGGAQTPQAGIAAEQQFRSIPNLVKVYELGFMRNAKEAQDFANRYGLNLRELAQSAQQLKQMGAL